MRRSNSLSAGLFVFALIAAVSCRSANAAIFYTSSTDFALAASGLSIENYGAYTPGTTLSDGSALGGLTYSFDTASGLGGVVTNLYNSVSGNSLGAKQTPGALSMSDFFYANDSFTVTFPTAVSAIGIFANINLPATLTLSAAGTGGTDEVTAYDTTTFGFVGIVSDTPFTSATFDSLVNPLTNASSGYNIAEIEYKSVSTVPLPASLPLFGAAVIGLGLAGLGISRKTKIDPAV